MSEPLGTPGPSVGERAFLSIGEVLDLLKGDFPDVTISKIRFLESQGLLDPERTPSGYRKFHEADVERLRWILHQQKENFLPLKVIKGRLAALRQEDGVEEPAVPPEAAPAPAPVPGADADRERDPSRPVAARPGPLDRGLTDHRFSSEELVRAAGLEPGQLAELERYGLVVALPGGRPSYDEDALAVARLAAAFARHGVDARHLKMYKNAAEREAAFCEQLVLPSSKQRDPAARARAVATLGELARLGESLRGALLRTSLRHLTGGS